MMATTALSGWRTGQRRMLRAAATVTCGGIAVKLAATAKEFVLAGIYGRSDAMDAFLIALLIPNLLINLIAESMNQALVPTLIRVRVREGIQAARALVSRATAASAAMLLGASLAVALLAPLFFPLLATHFSHAKLQLAVHLFYGLLPLILFGGVASNCSAILNAGEVFAIPALLPGLIPLLTIGGAVLLHRSSGIWAVAYATLAGGFLYALWAAALMCKRGFFRTGVFSRNAGEREVTRQFAPVLLSAVVASGGLFADQAMAAMLPPGSVSALVYGGRFVSVTLAVMGGPVATTLGPYFSKMVAKGDWGDCRATLRSWTRMISWVSIPITLSLGAGAPWLVRFTLQHGAFHAGDTKVVARVLACSAMQIPFFVVSRVDYRLIVAMRRTDVIFYCGTLNLVLDVVLNLVLMRWFGVAGIALATSLWTVGTWLFLRFWSRRLLRLAESRAGSSGELLLSACRTAAPLECVE